MTKFENKFDYNFNLLLLYLKEHDGFYPVDGEVYKGEALGRWVKVIRDTYNNGIKIIIN